MESKCELSDEVAQAVRPLGRLGRQTYIDGLARWADRVSGIHPLAPNEARERKP